ncbi:MAG: hypothetical protein AAF623_01240 [Planctomycetota bacterium]
MKLFFTAAFFVFWSTNINTADQETEKQSTKKVVKLVRIMAVKGNRMTVVESAGGRGRGPAMQGLSDNNSNGRSGRRRGMRGGSVQDNQSGNGTGRRRGRGRFGTQADRTSAKEGFTITVGEDVRVTYALQERRTNEFRVGADINGRLKNDIFKKIPAQGLTARIISDGTRLIEVNMIQENDTSTDDIAVKPKRPPRARK